ncbi:MAG TPA: S41 family peptidase [Tepidisphaeraceae bacterium]|nr:S41 family peptidase [Tepidisphaeraceae bacterium]
MRKYSTRLVLAAALVFTGAALGSPDQVATVDQLKTDAFKALHDGKWEVGNDLLAQAASKSKDPSDEKMASWTNQFETQQAGFAAERHKQYDKSVADVHLLEQHGYEDYAIDAAKDAYVLANDKDAFRAEPWVDDLINKSVAMAEGYEKKEEWLKALRLYSDLCSVEPTNPEWKDRLKLATRRIRLLALYSPGELKAVQESESKTRDAVDKLLHPDATTQVSKIKIAATQPAVPGDEADADSKLDWHDTLRGVKMDMLWTALVDARTNYWREITYRDMMVGGLKGMQALATTHGLEKEFPGLADDAKRQQFVSVVNDSLEAAKNSTAADDQFVLYNLLFKKLATSNKDTVNFPEEVLVSEFADGAFAELDPFSSMIWPSDLEEFNKTTQGEFSGVGIQIQNDDTGALKVVTPIEDTPAYKAGIKPDDIITQINGKSAKGISLTQAVRLIQGVQGTYVSLTIKSTNGDVKEHNLKRDTIKVSSIKGWTRQPGGGWDYLIDPDNKIAYVRCTNFTKSTGEDLDKTADEMKQAGAKGMILDLRYNPGGLLTAATEVCDKFMSKGVIVSTHADRETPNQPTVATAKLDDDEIKMPVIVLVNQYSASASEIVSGALKDQHRAMIVGERTYGKGSVQMLFPLAGRSAYLKLTTSHYYLPSGRCIHREENSKEWGVDPDVTVDMTPDQMRAAMDARQAMDILRDAEEAKPAEGEHEKLKDTAPAVKSAVEAKRNDEAAKKNTDPLACDPQLSAALLMLRLQLAGAQL